MADECKVDRVLDGVSISGSSNPSLERALEKGHFTHILVAVQGPVPRACRYDDFAKDHRMHIEIEDDDESLIIEYFKESSRFIHNAVKQGGHVVVVCAQGVSRSCTLVLAYMMEYVNRDATSLQCLEDLHRIYPQASPNQGFLNQLDVWHEMKFSYDMTHGAYRSLRARQTAKNVQSQGEAFDVKEFRDPRNDTSRSSILYSCRSCRAVLATAANIMVDVSVGSCKNGFSWKKKSKDHKNSRQADSHGESTTGSIFVEPLRWMKAITEDTQGKIYCYQCSSRLGSYNWSGMQNEDAEWITPAFQLHMSKLDINDMQRSHHVSMPAIRQPKLLGKKATRTKQICLIFDCDGVLVDSERASCEALRQGIRQVTSFDIPHIFPQDFVPVFGMDIRSCLKYYMRTYDLEDMFKRVALSEDVEDETRWMEHLVDMVSAAKTQCYTSITSSGIDPISGAASLMKDACRVCRRPDRALPLVGIASSGSHAKIRHNLESAKLWGIIEPQSIVSAQQVARGKPHPDVYVEALSILDCQGCGQDAIVIEDSIHGIHAAAAAGIGHIAAVTTSLTHEQMYEALNHLKRSSFDAADGARQPEEDEASRVPLTRTSNIVSVFDGNIENTIITLN
ncbi:hypothetical protein M9434_000667 [Picochlorum sp. BPE23]|nr:hypothetical protein M9434_000667 [Picochlorum sp. BPE23]